MKERVRCLKSHNPYLTVGKAYKVTHLSDGWFEICDDEGNAISCRKNGLCAYGEWQWEEDAQKEEADQRDWFAGMAIQGCLGKDKDLNKIAQDAYKLADEMMKERGK